MKKNINNHPNNLKAGSITVAVITYNQDHFLKKALRSVFVQTRPADEIIVIDNGSTDNTGEVVKQHPGKIRYIRNKKNRGAVAAFNQGLSLASGDYVILLSADDWFERNILEEEARILDENKKIAVVYSQAYVYSKGKKFLRVAEPAGEKTIIGRDEFERLLTKGDFIPLLTALVRRSVYQKLGLMDEKIKYRHDWEFWIKLAKNNKFAYLAKPLGYWRVGASYGVSSPEFLKSFEYDFGYILKKHLNVKNDESLFKVRNMAYHYFYMVLADEKILEGKYIQGLKLWLKAILMSPVSLTNLKTWIRLASTASRRINAVKLSI